jgi:formylglycine-generating enzyme required for sulfatase activity
MTYLTAQILPHPFEWMNIPAGKVRLANYQDYGGSAGGVYEIPAFQLAKFPVTQAQFQVFLDSDDGYRNWHWWDFSGAAKAWRGQNDSAKIPHYLVGSTLPRVHVSWYEALAFCSWLTRRVGKTITLPTEQQWQRAAQGDDERLYPWGNSFGKNRANAGDSNRPTTVDKHPDGASPYGVMDMAGNVWEWCLSDYATDKIDLSEATIRSLRGGAWSDLPEQAKTTTRCGFVASFRNYNIGFRVCTTS